MKRPTRDLLLEVRRLSEAAHEAHAELLAASELGALERRLLDLLAATDGPRTAPQLARSMLCTNSTIEASLHALRAGALICQHCVGSQHAYVLTTAGRAARCAVRQAELRLEEIVEADLDDDEVGRAIEVLRRARRRLDAARHAPRLRRPADARAAGFDPSPRRLVARGLAGVSVV